MRGIKFRGKKVDTGEWVYGNPVEWLNDSKDVSIVCHPFGCCIDHEGNLVLLESPFVCKVIPETVGQFAELIDKNKSECYEEDWILAYRRDDDDKEHPQKLRVTFLNGCFMVGTCTNHEFYRLYQSDFERIGNSFENPELLK